MPPVDGFISPDIGPGWVGGPAQTVIGALGKFRLHDVLTTLMLMVADPLK